MITNMWLVFCMGSVMPVNEAEEVLFQMGKAPPPAAGGRILGSGVKLPLY